MITRAILFLGSAIATAATGYGLLTLAAPSVAARIDAVVRDHVAGWSESACSADPAGCLQSRFGKLQELEASASASVRQLRDRVGQVKGMVEEQELIAEKNAAFLDRGKMILKDRGQSGDGPVEFAGRSYPNLATFRGQLQLLFEEKSALEANLASARALRKTLQERLDALLIHQGRISLAKRMIPSQIELVRANQTLKDFNGNLTMIDGVIKGTEGGLAESEQLIRSTKDLMDASSSAAAALPSRTSSSEAAFEDFLRK